MKDNHIIEILENSSFAGLSESDHSTIKAHTASCADCAHAYRAAMVSTSLLKERAGEVQEPSPFFSTRVMAAIRERQNETPAFARMWRAAGALVSSMAATVALFAVVSFVVPGEPLAGAAPMLNSYSAEEVILDQTEQAQEQISDAQIMSTLYAADDNAR